MWRVVRVAINMNLQSETEMKTQDQINYMKSYVIIRLKPKKTEQKDLERKELFSNLKEPNSHLERRSEGKLAKQKELSFLSPDTDMQVHSTNY